jgi:hypothetical protein
MYATNECELATNYLSDMVEHECSNATLHTSDLF